MRLIIISVLLIRSLLAIDTLSFSATEVKNGESVLILFSSQEILCDVKMRFQGRDFSFFPHPLDSEKRYLILPVHYNTPEGEKSLTLSYSRGKKRIKEKLPPLIVTKGSYPKESLRVDPAKIKLSKKDKKRAEKEYLQAMKIYNRSTQTFHIECETCLPMSSIMTSHFGNERLFNGVRKSYHSGVDYRAKTPSDVAAIGNGVVVLKDDRFYAGFSLIVDHGHGIYTGYYHLSSAHVNVGDKVVKDQIIALTGQSGRVTGPHLHFSMKVQGVTVNPLVVLKQINALLSQKNF